MSPTGVLDPPVAGSMTLNIGGFIAAIDNISLRQWSNGQHCCRHIALGLYLSKVLDVSRTIRCGNR